MSTIKLDDQQFEQTLKLIANALPGAKTSHTYVITTNNTSEGSRHWVKTPYGPSRSNANVVQIISIGLALDFVYLHIKCGDHLWDACALDFLNRRRDAISSAIHVHLTDQDFVYKYELGKRRASVAGMELHVPFRVASPVEITRLYIRFLEVLDSMLPAACAWADHAVPELQRGKEQ